MNTSRIAFAVYWLVAMLGFGAMGADGPVRFSFEQLWDRVRKSAPLMNAAEQELEASKIAASRAERHWYPRFFTQARVFATNDPAQSFMAKLGQREITAADFSPEGLNQPGSKLYEQATLGLDFPLYEGGIKAAQAASASKAVEAREFERMATAQARYVELAQQYADLMIVREERMHLDRLKESVDRILSRYDIGTKANPVGYSGLLGLRNLKNRIQGMLLESNGRMATILRQISTQAGGLPEGWIPEPVKVAEFLKRRLPIAGTENPAFVKAAYSASEALRETEGAERARFLPRLGLFAQADLYGGDRGVGTSYSTGAYLQWDLFSAGNLGAVKQAKKSAGAAEARADAAAQQAQIARENSLQGVRVAEGNLSLMDESAQFLEEQTATAQTLFRNGSINALQLVEVLSRRADLLANRAAVQLELSRATAVYSMNSEWEKYHGAIEK